MDVDVLIERRGRFLVLEAKPWTNGVNVGFGQHLALDALAQEAESPTREEFRRALFETQLGHTMPSALRAVANRVRSEDFDWVVQAIEIQGHR